MTVHREPIPHRLASASKREIMHRVIPTIGISLLAFISCKDKPADQPGGQEARLATFWQELELTPQTMKEYCDAQRRDHKENPRGPRDFLESLPAKSVKTPRWSGFLRFAPTMKGPESFQAEACFVNVTIPSADVARPIDGFREELGLPACATQLKSPSALACFVAPDDESGLAMWHARFNGVDELVSLGVSTTGYAPAHSETMQPPNWLRPKARPVVDAPLQMFDVKTPRFEVDEAGITFATRGPISASDLEVPAIAERFPQRVTDCTSNAPRCTVLPNTDRAARTEQIRSRLRRFEREGRLVKKDNGTRTLRTIAIDAAGDQPWSEVRPAVVLSQAYFEELLLIGERPADSELASYGALPLSAEQPSATPKVEEVPEPSAEAPTIQEARITQKQITVQLGENLRSFARTDSGYPWSEIHLMLAEERADTLTRPTFTVSASDGVAWKDVVKLSEVAAFRRAKPGSRSTCDVIAESFAESVPCLEGPLYVVTFSGR